MNCVRSTLLVIFFIAPYAFPQGPTAAEFDTQIARLTPKATKEVRLQVGKWLRSNYTAKEAPRAIPALEQLVQKDPEADVRRVAVAALVYLVNRHDVECPLGLIVALRDPVDEVRWEASVLAGPYKKRLVPGALDALIAAATDERAEVRSMSLVFLAMAAGKEAKARDVIEKSKRDRVFDVRHSAHCAWFTATDDLLEFLTYHIRIREEPTALLDPLPEGSEEAKIQQSQRNLFLLGGVTRVIEWKEQRPDDLAAALVKLLEHKSAAIRRGTADLIGVSARRVEIKHSDPFTGLDFGKSPFESLLPYIDPDAKTAKEKPVPLLPSKVYPRLLERKAVSRLRYAATMDEDKSVRAAARQALKRFAELPEPLSVLPREVSR